MTIKEDIQTLEPGQIIEVFELDATSIGGGLLRFHQHLQQGPIWWKGIEYLPWPIKLQGFARTTEQPPTPRMTVSNINGSISVLCRMFDDLAGAQITRRRTLVKYLDPINFPGENLLADPGFTGSLAAWNPNSLDRVQMTENGIEIQDVAGADGVISRQVTGTIAGQEYLVTLDFSDNTTTSLGALYLRATATPGAGGVVHNVPGGYMARYRFTITAPSNDFWLDVVVSQANTKVVLRQLQVQPAGTNATADPTQEFAPDIWFIETKATENREIVEFELASAMDLNGVQLPRRQIIANHCPFVAMGGYRGPYCGYAGPPVAKRDDTPTTDPAEDDCGGKLSSCKLRQWPDGVLNFGGFPAAGLMRT